ncbi:MAG: hypothetical protein DSM106950_14420 [Stigonema ocellatum SAG 48.90 = DSM 106950]|nr:hypothetical protein [Stigonema ocellatum SAG 48.90 = DSM 106950]
MPINRNIKFGISKSGIYLLDFIAKEKIEQYLHRINFYNVNYKVVTRKRKLTDDEVWERRLKIDEEEVCCVFFSWIEEELIKKLIAAYGFLDKRKYLIPKSNNFICFLMDNFYIIACNKKISNQIKLMNNYLSQYSHFNYKLIHIEDYGIFITRTTISNLILEDIVNSIGIVDENHEDHKTIEELLKVQNLVKIYNKDIVSNRVPPPIYYFGHVRRY